MDGMKVNGFAGVVLKLQPELPDVIVHCSRRGVILVPPNFVQKL
jgi:hypothetical protein